MVVFSFLIFTSCGSSEKQGQGSGEEAAAPEQGQSGKFVVALPSEMEEAMKEILTIYPEAQGIEIVADKSGANQNTIEQGSDIDLFISGDEKQLITLARKGLLDGDSMINITKQDLVMIQDNKVKTPIESIEEIDQIEGKIAIGNIDTVPVGRITEEALINLDLWNKIQEKIRYMNSSEVVIANVEQGESDIGFVYRTHMKEAKDSSIVASVDPTKYTPVIIPGGIITGQDQGEKVTNFLQFLQSDEAQEILVKHGFMRIEE